MLAFITTPQQKIELIFFFSSFDVFQQAHYQNHSLIQPFDIANEAHIQTA